MSTFQRHYKAKTLGFGDPAVARVIRAKTQEQTRKTRRNGAYTENRNIPNISSHASGSASNTDMEEPPASVDRMTRLLNWKKSREMQRKLEKVTKKQPFVVRAVDEKIFSLPMDKKYEKKPPPKSVTPSSKRITKATEKRIMRRAQLVKVVKPSIKSPQSAPEKECHELNQKPLFGRTCLSFDKLLKKDIDSSKVKVHNTDNSFQPEHVDMDKKSIFNSPIANEPIFNSPIANEPIFFSPYVVSSRGKSNARNEQRMKRGFSLGHSSGDDIPTKDTVMRNMNISIEEEERTAQYFQFLLSKEVDRLNELCDKWTAIKEEPDTPEDGQYQINQAVGQTNLLISKKFERFRRLVTDCETGKGSMLVTCKDLQGFWDMMYMEIRNCDSRFDKLEQLHSQGWKEKDLYDAKKLPVKKTAAVNKKVVLKKASSVIAFMKEKRKKMMKEAANTSSIKYEIFNTKGKTRTSIGSSDNKRSLINKHDKKRSSLLQNVQLSAIKKPHSPLTIMKISQMCKTPEVKLDSTISYINSDQTPGKSILKQSKKSNEIESCTKSSYKVNFNDTITLNEVPIDEETQTKMDLAAALAKIDSLEFNDSIEDERVHAEKRLIFDDSSSDECEDVFDTNAHSEKIESTTETVNISPVEIEGATSLEPPTLRNNSISQSPKRRLRRQTALDISNTMLDIVSPPSSNEIINGVDLNVTQTLESKEKKDEYTENVRVLRNRSVTLSNIPTPRRSTKMSAHKQESQYKENIDSKDDLSNDIPTISLNEESKMRKSRSIKFSEKECNTYREKTAFPLTPHTRRSKILSSEKKRRTTFANSMSTSSPVKPPERIRRSRNRMSSAAF